MREVEFTVNIPVRVLVRVGEDGVREILRIRHVGQSDQPQRHDELFEDFDEAVTREVNAHALE